MSTTSNPGSPIATDYSQGAESGEIPFPAPATPGRSMRGAAKAAASKISTFASKQAAMLAEEASDAESSMTDGQTDDTMDSYTAADGETDEMTYDEAELTAAPTEDDEPAPKKRKTPVKRKAKSSDADGGSAKKAKTGKGAKGKKAAVAKQENDDDGHASDSSQLTPAEELEEKPKKTRKPRKPRAPKPEPVYVIPDVEQLENPGYTGRLGFACLNTILRKRKPPVFCSRTCRIDSIKKNGMDFLKELGKQNMRDLAEMIQWNEDNNIKFMRLSSDMFPFASHELYGYTLEYADEELKAAGALINKYGHRATTHPGQFTQLGSPRKEVAKNAVRDLVYHCEMLDRMGIDQDGVMIIHGGGVYGDKAAAMERFRENYRTIVPDNVKARLVLENDEICYNVDDLLPICEELGIPLVLDYHHHSIYPTAETPLAKLMPRILATWEKKGIRPKFHLSEERPGAVTVMERRAHSDRCKRLPEPLPSHVDLMIEAKDKEQAVFHLHRIYNLAPTIHANLRPPAEVESMRTNGRKSNKKKKKAADDEEEAEDDEEHEHVLDEDGETCCKPDPDQEMINMDGAEVAKPRDEIESPTKKTRTPAKARAKKTDTPAKEKKTPAKTPRGKKVKKEEETQEAIEQILAEPAEGQPTEDMKMEDVPESIAEAVPCEPCKGANDIDSK